MNAPLPREARLLHGLDNSQTIEIVRGALPSNSRLAGAVIALGNFDGFHRGHRFLLQQAHRLAARRLPVAIMSAEPHPRQFFNPGTPLQRLALPTQKHRLARELGLDYVFEPRFDQSFASLTPHAFVREVLHDMLQVSHVVIGENFRFGAGRAGDCTMLTELSADMGIGVEVVSLQGRVSSSRIRDALARGDLDTVHDCLGRAWEAKIDQSGNGHVLASGLIRPAEGQYLVHDPDRGQTFTVRLDAGGRLDGVHQHTDRIAFLTRLPAVFLASRYAVGLPLPTTADDHAFDELAGATVPHDHRPGAGVRSYGAPNGRGVRPPPCGG